MLREDALEFVGQLWDAARRRDIPRLVSFYSNDAVVISPVFGTVKGKSAIEGTWNTMFATFADLSLTVLDVLVDGDRVAVLGEVRATDRLGWFGLPPTGQIIDYRLVLLLTIANGQIVRDDRVYDSAGLMQRLEKMRLDQELKMAAEVQRALLSRSAQSTPFCESVGNSVASRAIGGDFFEFIDLPSGSVGLAIGDVAGKGPPAALLAAMLQGVLASQVSLGGGPAAVLSRINQILLTRRLESRFATMVYAEVSPDRRLVYSNAGHNAPVLLSNGSVRRLTAGGCILGVFAKATFEQEEIVWAGEETLAMFTDGLIEARNVRDEEFGEDRLLRLLERGASLSPSDILREILTSVQEFCNASEQTDDITLAITRLH